MLDLVTHLKQILKICNLLLFICSGGSESGLFGNQNKIQKHGMFIQNELRWFMVGLLHVPVRTK
jgi:hypothetical protein